MDDLARRIEALSPAQLEELDRKLRARGPAPGPGPGPAARGLAGRPPSAHPLSFAQERLWFLDQLRPGTPIYNLPTAVRLPGPLDVAALERAVTEIVRRHESLRTTFPVEHGRPVQRIGPAQPVPVPLVELRNLPAEAREAELQRLIAHEAMHVFDLARGPVLRALLVRVDELDHALVLTTHHIASDGWSTGVLLRELGALYEAFAAGRPSPLPELPLQYADHAVAQREQLAGERLAELVGYWKQALDGAPATLELPADRPRPAVQSFRGAWRSFAIGREVGDRLGALAREEGATLFMVLLAAFDALLFRYTGQRDVVIGTPIANRNRAEIEPLIGFFVNTLVLRARVSGELTFRELVAQVREVTLGAYAHQDLPFEKLVEELHPDRTLSHNPLFQVMFVLQNAPTLAPPPAPAAPGPGPAAYPGLSKFDLTLSFVEHPDGLSGTIEYSTDLFEHQTIARMIGHLEALLADAGGAPDRRVRELALLTPAERHQILVEWNDTRADYPARARVHELIEAQVDRTPDAAAVVFEGLSLDYRELDERANKLAHELRALGVGPEVRVGLCVERSLEMVVGALAILKAGGVYLPLDPTHPRDRLAYMIEDAGAPVLLTQARFLPSLPAGAARAIALDAEWERIARRPGHRPAVAVDPDGALAVFYTSGSTGQPKGSIGHGRGFVNLVHWYRRAASIGPGSRVLLMTPFTFDASFKNLLTPLVAGGAVVLADPGYDVREIARTIERERVTTTFTTPSLLYAMLEDARAGGYAALASLQTLFVGGEATEVARLRPWLASPGCRCRVIHIYGPSECSDVATCFVPPPGWLEREPGMPIGRPIPNARAYVLDAEGGLVPIGVPGELCISGLIVGRGYLGRPGLTAERFVPDPFLAGERLYRTGDRVRWLASGDLEFLGRIDHQVKIRGVRIELTEIEGAVASHRHVARVAVLAREDAPGDRRLVAYVVPRPGAPLAPAELRRHLKDRVPDYMVPSAFVVLEDLPLSPNGKIDRGALPAPEAARGGRAEDLVLPRDPIEEVTASIWSEVLGAGALGVHENFFELGGHSLLATQVVSRLRDAFQIDLPLRRLFEAPTIAELSAALAADAGDRARLEHSARLLLQVAELSDAEVDALSRQQAPGGTP